MICKFCSEEIPENSLLCPNCGIFVNETGVPDETVYICPVCGTENPPGERKCLFCCSIFTEK